MQNDYYQTNNRQKLIMIAISLASLCVIALIILCTILVVKNNNGGSLGGLDPNFITVEFDGTKFKIADTYGEVIREIAKQRTIYEWGGLMDHTYAELTGIENYLDQYILGDEEYSDGNDKNTIIKKDSSDYPDIFIEVDRTYPGLNEKATKINDADVRVIVYTLDKKPVELKIDGHALTTMQTTSEEFEDMFKDAKEYISGNSTSQDYKVYDFIYKKRRFGAAFNSENKLFTLEIDTHAEK